jgi:hypothetical protein
MMFSVHQEGYYASPQTPVAIEINGDKSISQSSTPSASSNHSNKRPRKSPSPLAFGGHSGADNKPDINVPVANMKTARPYRSHKYPACTRCHKRRSRCTIEVPGQACLLCRMHGVPCSSATGKKEDRATPKIGFIHRSMLPENDNMALDESSYIVGPIVARDNQVIDQYLPQAANGNSGHVPIQPNLGRKDSQQKPIYRAAVPPRRATPQDCSCSRNLPDELLSQVDPFLDKVVANFYENVHPAFPFTEESCVVSRLKTRHQIPSNFLANLVAHALFYWDLSPALSAYARPDQDFAWQVGTSVNNSEFSKNNLANILSMTMNLAGRPSTNLINNSTNVAKTVALAHAIGLNHDCAEWKMLDQERRVRWKAWWGVVVHDRWFNFAQGTPPYISKNHYDVPLPTLDLLTGARSNSLKHVRAAEVFIHLCKLTEIVGDVLPLIYHIRSGNDTIAAEQTSRSEIELNRWIESRPGWLDLSDFTSRPAVPGLVNLQLSFLAVRMLLRRIAWHEISQRETEPAASWLSGCQAAAEDIVRFTASLQKTDLRGFWLPYNAHHFTSAVTLLLRCALQTNFPEVRKGCMTSARALVDNLRRHFEESGWDLAETALASSENILRRIEDAVPREMLNFNSSAGSTPALGTPSMQNLQTSSGFYGAGLNGLSGASGFDANGQQTVVGVGDDGFLSYQGQQGSIEELFPEIFGEFQDTALFSMAASGAGDFDEPINGVNGGSSLGQNNGGSNSGYPPPSSQGMGTPLGTPMVGTPLGVGVGGGMGGGY